MANFEPVDYDPFAAATAGNQPRGIRNNNPLNIEAGNFTASQPGFQGSDGRFARFADPEQGFAAAENLLDVYGRKHGLRTVAEVINRWAPPSDGNPVSAYAASVARDVGVGPNDPIDLANPQIRSRLSSAMATFENGRPVPRATDISAQRQTPTQQPQLTPVDHDPFAEQAPAQPATPQGATFKERYDALSDPNILNEYDAANKPKFGLGDTWPARLAKSVFSAARLPGDVMNGTTPIVGEDGNTNPEVTRRSFDLAAVATPQSVANRALPKAVPVEKPAPPPATPTIAELKGAATVGYESPEVTGLVIRSKPVTDFAGRVRQDLNEAGFDENVAPKTLAILAKIEEAPNGAFVTGKNLDSLRKTLGKAAGSTDPSERAAAAQAIEALDNLIPNLGKGDVLRGDASKAAETLATARANYSAAKHSESIDAKTIQAELRAAAANSGQNVANTVRQRLADVLLKDKQKRGFTPAELQMMEEIVRGSRGENALRTAGNVLGGGGGLGAVAAAGAGAYATGGPGAVAPLVGWLLKSASNKMTLKQAEKLSTMIRDRAPLASAGRKFEEKAAEFAVSKSPKTLAGVSLAARNFASNLQASGFNVNVKDLMTGLQAGGIGRADENQQ